MAPFTDGLPLSFTYCAVNVIDSQCYFMILQRKDSLKPEDHKTGTQEMCVTHISNFSYAERPKPLPSVNCQIVA